MIKSKDTINKRSNFVKLAFNDKKRAAKQLNNMAQGLENCRNTSDIVKALQEILFLSEKTIFNDFIREKL